MSNNTIETTVIQIPDCLKEMKLIPLQEYSKIPKNKWGTNEELTFDGSENSYGIDTGRSNLVVIDCDTKGAENGINNFYAQCTANDYEPNTFTVETPNEGLHFYYITKNKNIKTSAGTVFGPGIDVRAQGGYVVGPGSLVKNNNGEPILYNAWDDTCEIEEIPKWIEEKILNSQKKEKTTKTAKTTKNTIIAHEKNDSKNTSNEEEERNNALVWALDKMSSASEGTRNSTLNSTAYFMGCKRVEYETAEQLINIAVQNGLNLEEATTTFNSGYEAGLQEEKISYSVMVKEFNTKNGITFKDDPKDPEFYSHMSLSYNFWNKYKSDFIYFDPNNCWYQYNSKNGSWEVTSRKAMTNNIKDYCENLVLRIREENARLPMAVYKAQEKVWLKNTIESVEAIAELDFLESDKNKFDSDPLLINCKNGVYDLENDKLLEHNRNYFITKNIPINYVNDAKDKYCDMIINGVAKSEKEYLQLIVGEALIGRQPQIQSIFFFHGHGSNGKSTFIDLLTKTSGTYGKIQSPSVLLPDLGRDNYALADFEGIRQAIIEELPDSKQLNSSALKRIVGTDKINARPIYGKNREFENQSTVFVTCNRLPVITETDDGTWRRLLVFTFPYSYKRFAKDVKNASDRLGDPRVIMAAKNNRATAEAFLSWRIEGAKKALSVISNDEIIPDSMIETVTNWNENNDVMLGWVRENIVSKQNSVIIIGDLLTSYNEYLDSRGHSKVSLRLFVDQFTNHTFFMNNNLVYRKGARLIKDYKHSKLNVRDSTPEKANYILGIEFL